jgi:hypothetical protein
MSGWPSRAFSARRAPAFSPRRTRRHESRLAEDPDLPTQELLRRAKEIGYTGHRTAFYALVAGERRNRAAKTLAREFGAQLGQERRSFLRSGHLAVEVRVNVLGPGVGRDEDLVEAFARTLPRNLSQIAFARGSGPVSSGLSRRLPPRRGRDRQ